MFGKRNVSCANCGFLYWEEIGEFFQGEPKVDDVRTELGEFDRITMTDKEADPPYVAYLENEETKGMTRLACLRNQWVVLPEAKASGYYASIEEIVQKRKCLYHMKYIPGFSPEEHKDLQREQETRKTVFQATLVGAIIGALAAIIAQVIYAIFST